VKGGAVTGCVPFHEKDGIRRAIRHGGGQGFGDREKDSDIGRVTYHAKTGDESGRRNEAIARRRAIGRTNSGLNGLPLGGQSIRVSEDSRAIETPRGHISRCPDVSVEVGLLDVGHQVDQSDTCGPVGGRRNCVVRLRRIRF
jgi:hypothetical protein